MKPRLFIPLATGPFEDFRDHGKQAELRSYGRQYTERHVLEGRTVELRKGYSLREDVSEREWRLWGEIGSRITIGSLDIIFSEFEFKEICPRTESPQEAEDVIARIVGEHNNYIAFEIKLTSTE